jgi:hypothetical protein
MQMNAAAVKVHFSFFLFDFLNPARPAARVLKKISVGQLKILAVEGVEALEAEYSNAHAF